MYDGSRTILPRNQSTSFVEMDSGGIEKLYKSVEEGCSKHLWSAEIPFLYRDTLQTCVFPASCLLVEVGTEWDLISIAPRYLRGKYTVDVLMTVPRRKEGERS